MTSFVQFVNERDSTAHQTSVNVCYSRFKNGTYSAPIKVFASATQARTWCITQNASRSANEVALGEEFSYYSMWVE